MNEINDFYEEPKTGRKWIPQSLGDTGRGTGLVYCRSDFHGHISHGIFIIQEDGQFGPGNIKRFHDGSMAMTYLRDHSESLPRQHTPSGTRSLLGECNPCTEAEAAAAKAENTRRYNESKQRVINLKEGVKDEDE